jgi:hypothetical protein
MSAGRNKFHPKKYVPNWTGKIISGALLGPVPVTGIGWMLNDADGYQGGGEVDGEASGKVKDADKLFSRLKRLVKSDYNSKGQVNWRKEAREDFDFDAGEQLNADDKTILQDTKRPIVIFNRVGTTSIAFSGQEVGNRQEVQFLPRRQSSLQRAAARRCWPGSASCGR